MPNASEMARADAEAVGVGHNSVAVDELRAMIERVERVEEEQRALQGDKKDIYAEAKARGYDPKTMRRIVAIRRMERQVFEEQRTLEDTYLSALGLL